MNTYWRSIEELANPKELRRVEVREEAKQKSMLMRGDNELNAASRRDFLKTFEFLYNLIHFVFYKSFSNKNTFYI